MKNKLSICISTVLLLAIGQNARAQYAYFPAEGTIEYEKTVHVKNLLRKYIATLKDDFFSEKRYREMLDRVPETAVLRKKLSFRGSETSFESIADDDRNPLINSLLQNGMLDYQATVYQDLSKSVSRTLFELGGSPFLVQDSLLKVKWKITDEYRDIAGYVCRRANGLVLDSVYVVAFYTDQIPTSAGPGTLHGLPGMILGLVVPEQHFNSYATKVDFAQPTLKTSLGGKKNKPMTRREVRETIKGIVGARMSDQQFNLLVAGMFL